MNAPDDGGGHARCGGRTRSGKPCKLPAGHHTSHPGIGRCDHHGGATPSHEIHARRAQAADACSQFGVPVETTAEEALLDLLACTTGEVLFYRQQVSALAPADMVSGITKVTSRRTAEGSTGETVIESKPNVWLLLLNEAEKKQLAVADTIVRLGIERRKVDLAEKLGERMYRVILAVITDLGVRPDDPRILEVVPRRLRELSA